MDFSVDRHLPVSLRSQLHGLIEYGIACGELGVGEVLPSVRDLAEQAGVSPMTVSQVYADLKAAGLIETRPGSGTFVTGNGRSRISLRRDTGELHRRVNALIDESVTLGVSSAELVSLVSATASYRDRVGNRMRIAMIGLFTDATASYARFIAARLGNAVTVEPMTLAAIERDANLRARANSADIAVTFANRLREVAALVPGSRVVAVSFTPSEETRRALASLDSLQRVTVVSRFPDFLPIMNAGIRRFAPHVAAIDGVTLETTDLDRHLAACDVAVFATGAEAVVHRLTPGTASIEYRHAPDSADIERVIGPLLRAPASPSANEKRQAS